MHKKITKLLSITLTISMLFSISAFAEEPGTIRDMAYEEWLAEQENISDSASTAESDMEPVKVISQEQEVNAAPQAHEAEGTGNTSLDAILKEKGTYDLRNEVNRDRLAYDVTDSISSDGITELSEPVTDSVSSDNIMELSAPTAGLLPAIYNEESLVNGEISTDTVIVFFYNDTVDDDVTITGRYVDGNAVPYILGEIDGGFVMQITEPGSYQLYYQIEDSTGAFSRTIMYSIDVVAAAEQYQVFEGSFRSASDSATYNFSIDFSQMDSAAVCLVKKGYVGTNIKVYDEGGSQIFVRATTKRQAKNWGFIDKPSANATVCNYTVVATPSAYENRASDYRIIIGDKNDTELMMSGIENTVLLEQYYEAQNNLQHSDYAPNIGEYWYKYKRESTSVITILSNVKDIRFKILDISSQRVMFDSASNSDTHKTTFTGSGAWTCAEKARLTTVVGTEYYLVVYCTNPNASLPIRDGSTMSTAVGNPVMCPGGTTIEPGRSVTARSSGYSSTTTFTVDGNNLPNTAQIVDVTLHGVLMSRIERWRLIAPNSSSWSYNNSSFYPSVDMGYQVDTSNNAYLKGTWSAAFMSPSSTSSVTFTPEYTFSYYYEYGD